MDWPTATALGAVGGAVVEAISAWENLVVWQKARHGARASHHRPLPKLNRYIDPLADTLVAVTRLVLGAAAGALLHLQVTGTIAAIAVGASAPALLRQLGTVRSVQETIEQGTVGVTGVLSSVPDEVTSQVPHRVEGAE